MGVHSITIEHIDPRNGLLVSGLCNEFNEVIAESSYNSRKTNRFVPYRVKDYPAPVTFGDLGEFLINGVWTVCEFGGPEWWEESNKIGNANTKGGKKGGEKTVVEGKGIHYPEYRESEEYKEMCRESGKKVVVEGLGVHNPEYRESEEHKEMCKGVGKKTVVEGLGIHKPEYRKSENYLGVLKRGGKANTPTQQQARKESGKKAVGLGLGIHNPDYRGSEECLEKNKRGGKANTPAQQQARKESGDKTARKCSKPVVCVETETVYPSSEEAARQTNGRPGNIRRSARSGGKRSGGGGLHWVYPDPHQV